MQSLRLPSLVIAVFLGTGVLYSQSAPPTGSAAGTVHSIDGDVIPGAVIVVKAGGKQKTTVSNHLGVWKFDGLKPGTASVYAKLSGWVSRRTQLQIAAGQTAQWNVTLRPGQIYRPPADPVGPDPTDPTQAAGVYSVVLRRMIQGSIQKPMVITTSLVVPYLDEEWPEGLTMVPDPVRRAAATPEAQKPVTLRAESLPAQARLIDPKSKTRPDGAAAWLSRVFFSEDQLGALVMFAQSCVAHCGRGELLWLQRKSAADKWKVHTAHLLWIE